MMPKIKAVVVYYEGGLVLESGVEYFDWLARTAQAGEEQRRLPWHAQFEAAEAEAKKHKRGIWSDGKSSQATH